MAKQNISLKAIFISVLLFHSKPFKTTLNVSGLGFFVLGLGFALEALEAINSFISLSVINSFTFFLNSGCMAFRRSSSVIMILLVGSNLTFPSIFSTLVSFPNLVK